MGSLLSLIGFAPMSGLSDRGEAFGVMDPLFRLELRGEKLCAILGGDEAELYLFGEHRKWIVEQVWPSLVDHVGPKSLFACGVEFQFKD